MNATGQLPVFHMEKTTGFATMRDLWRAAMFIADVMNFAVYVEGVTSASNGPQSTYITAPPVSATNNAGGMNITGEKPLYLFKRRKGLARRRDLEEFERWLVEKLRVKLESNDVTGAISNDVTRHVDFKINPALI